MALDLSALSVYTEQNKLPLIVKSIFTPKTISLMNKQTGIKSSATINIMETDANFQDGNSCGFVSSGTTALSQRTLTVGNIAVMESICPKKLNQYYIQKELAQGSLPENERLPFEEVYANEKVDKIASQLETAVWLGDTNSSNINLKRFDGLKKIIDAASGVIAATASTYNSTNCRTIIDNIYANIPAALLGKDDLRVFMGWDNFRTLLTKITNDNLFSYVTDKAAETGELNYPGNGLKIVAVHGLNSTNRIFALRTSNMYFGTDLENEEENFKIFYAEEAMEVRYVAEFKAGTQIAFPAEIVQYTNA